MTRTRSTTCSPSSRGQHSTTLNSHSWTHTPTPPGPTITTNLFLNSGPTLVPLTLKPMLKMSLNGSKCMIIRKLLNAWSAFSSSPPKVNWGNADLCHQFYNRLLTTSRMKSQELASQATSTNSTPSSNPSMPAIRNVTPSQPQERHQFK